MTIKLKDVSLLDIEREKELLSIINCDDCNLEEIEELCAPGTYSCHEVVTSLHMIINIFNNHVANHPSVLCNKAWYLKARQIEDNIRELQEDVEFLHLEETYSE